MHGSSNVAMYILSFAGVRPLYLLCVDYVVEKYEFNKSLLERILPPRIEKDVSQRDRRE